MSNKTLWAKCPVCKHCWPAAYYPIDMAKLGALLAGARCPKGCDDTPLVAKQEDGKLLEKEP